jgi:thiosulfate dehydrogenase (quinone) large subunit
VTGCGEASGSSNPITDYHFVYAAAVVLVLTHAGDTWAWAAGGPRCRWFASSPG